MADAAKLNDLAARADPANAEQQALLAEMRAHVKKLEAARAAEDPRLSFSTPEFKAAQRAFGAAFKANFGRPAEWGLVKDHAWSTPALRRLDGGGGGAATGGEGEKK